MSVNTKTRNGSYKGHLTCEIVQVDESNQPIGKPLMSFGVKKAKIILDHIDDIKRFVDNNTSPTSASHINLEGMSSEEKNILLAKLLAQ